MSPNKVGTAGPSKATGKTWEWLRELQDGGAKAGSRANILRCKFGSCLVNTGAPEAV